MRTVYRACVLDAPEGPVGAVSLRADDDAALVVVDGVITARTTWAAHVGEPGDVVHDLRDGLLLPGFVDTHVHLPQLPAIGGLGRPLLEWLEAVALPAEARMHDPVHAAAVARQLLDGLRAAGTTSALVFGAHVADAVDTFFAAAEPSGLRVTCGLVVGDRHLREDLHTDPRTALEQGRALAARWHGAGEGRLRYAVTPRFALATTDAMLASCADLLQETDGALVTSHLNENAREVQEVAALFPRARDYLDTYDRHGLLGPSTVMAHDIHPTDAELRRLGETGTAVAHCATSNAALGSGLFPMRRHLDAGVRVALGSDVGAGTGLSMIKEGLQASFAQQLLGDAGVPLRAADLLHLATRAGALALGLADVGHLAVGMQMDAVLLRPPPGSTTDVVLRHAADADDALAKVFALGTSADVARVWVSGVETSPTLRVAG